MKGILIAGIGNIFHGDDAFGVEAVRYLNEQKLPEGVKVIDFGIRAYDLAYALCDGYDLVILLDAAPHGKSPGTVSLIRPEAGEDGLMDAGPVDAHSMNPMAVLEMARQMGGELGNLFLVGCEPATLGGSEGHMGLSPVVNAAVPKAADLVQSLIAEHFKQNRNLERRDP